MQCPTCQFENMPGSPACAACSTSLTLGGSAIAVHPPRARPLAKSLRRATAPVRRIGALSVEPVAAVKEAVRSGVAAIPIDPLMSGTPSGRVLSRLMLPALPQFAGGQRLRGRVFLPLYLALALSAVCLLGSDLGSVFLGLAFAVHVASALDGLAPVFAGRIIERLVATFAVMLGLYFAVYFPAWFLLSRVAAPTAFNTSHGIVQAGEVLLVARSQAIVPPKPGRLVLYTVSDVDYMQFAVPNRPQTLTGLGQRLDRVLATAGDRVTVGGRLLLVNDRVTGLTPARSIAFPRFSVVVPAGHVFILPSTIGDARYATAEQLEQLSLIPLGRVEGVAWFRTSPFARAGALP